MLCTKFCIARYISCT
uniref:Uncharacterized protein n=1 Tax=Arundo donax TaxID=35708 RepID=A0A0A9DVM3_ARUDO